MDDAQNFNFVPKFPLPPKNGDFQPRFCIFVRKFLDKKKCSNRLKYHPLSPIMMLLSFILHYNCIPAILFSIAATYYLL